MAPIASGGKRSFSTTCSLPPIPEHIPNELRDRPQWVGWKLVPNPDRPRPEKVPIDPSTGRRAKPNAPATWGTFPDALRLYERERLSGVGFFFSENDRYIGIDLDCCRDPATGAIELWAREIIGDVGSYSEVSPSETGVKLVAVGRLPEGIRNRGRGLPLEVYDKARYFALTGHRLDGAPADIRPIPPDALGRLCDRLGRRDGPPGQPRPPLVGGGLDDADLLRRAVAHPQTGPRLAALLRGEQLDHRSQSEADYELARLLGYWCGGDAERVRHLMRASDTARDKWERRDYLRRTIERALSRLSRVYDPAMCQTPSPCTPTCADKSVTPHPGTPGEQADRLLAHIRRLRQLHGRPVALSVRQAGELLGIHYRTAARRLTALAHDGRLILVTGGRWDSSTGQPGPASIYDLPEGHPAHAAGPSARRTHGTQLGEPSPQPPYTRTPGGLVAVWHWSARRGQWQSYGDCTGRAAAAALAARHMARKPGWWAVGDELRRYVRGRRRRVTPNKAQANEPQHHHRNRRAESP
jgi:hypothetical protein